MDINNDNMVPLYNKLKNNNIKINDYTFEKNSEKKLNLTDQIVIYNSGDIWKIVPLIFFLTYPIIYDKYSYEDEQYDITIVICPVSLTGIVLKGIFTFHSYVKYDMVLQENDKDNIISLNDPYKINNDLFLKLNWRSEIKIMTFRNSLILYPDAYHFKSKLKIDPIINLTYYNNNDNDNNNSQYHSKTLVYIIKYKSIWKNDTFKTSILLGHNINKNKVTGYDIKKSHLFTYLLKNKARIINKKGYIFPMLLYIAEYKFPNAEIIKI
jgi:hypothetical protein